MKVKELLATKSPEIFTIRPDQTVMAAMRILAERHIGVVIVVDEDGTPLGIISERDIVREGVRQGAALFDQTAASIMTKNLIIAEPEDEITYLSHTMTAKNIRHLPVMDEGNLIGIISIRDVVRVQVAHYSGEIHTLQYHLAEYMG